MAATAGVRSDLTAVEAAAGDWRNLHDTFTRQWNEHIIIKVCYSAPLLLSLVHVGLHPVKLRDDRRGRRKHYAVAAESGYAVIL